MHSFGRVAPSVPVRDLSKAIQFYKEALGFAVTFTNGDPASFAIIKQGVAELHLGQHSEKAGSSHIHIMVDDLDVVYERLKKAGATIRQASKVQEWGLRDIVIADPDGNTFELAEPVGATVSK